MAAEDGSVPPSAGVVMTGNTVDGQPTDLSVEKKSPTTEGPSHTPDNVIKCAGCHVNVDLIPLKAHYFCFYGALSGVIIPMILYCRQLGMSLPMVGLLFGVLPFVQLISKPVSGVIADKIGKHKSVFIFNLIVLAVSLFSTNFIPNVRRPTSYDASIEGSGVGGVRWRPEQSASIECFADGPFHIRTCDYLHDNESALSLQLLATTTVGCNLTCGPTQFEEIQRLFCDSEHPDCLLRSSKYSFYDTVGNRNHVTLVVSIDPAPNANVQPSPHLFNSDLFCTTLAVSNVSITDVLFPTMHLHMATTASCPSRVHSAFQCPGVCKTSYASSSSSSSIFVSNGTFEPVRDSVPVESDATLQFLWVWTACIIGWAAYGAALSTSDTILMVILGEAKRGEYGKTRLFSSVGWGILSPITAYLNDMVSEGKPLRDFSPGFYVFFALMIVDILVVCLSPAPHTEKPRRLAADVLRLFATPRVLLFAAAVFAIGVTTGFLWCFLVVYAVNDLGGSQLSIGLNYAVECLISEVPLFAASGWIVDRIGYSHSMTFVLFIGAFKCLVYSVITNAWYMLLVALVHGVMYGLMYATLASYAAAIAPPGAATTLQGIFQGIFEGAGVGIGTIIGGVVYERIGGRQTFFVFGAATMLACIAHFFINFLMSSTDDRNDKQQVAKLTKHGILSTATPSV